MLLFNNRQQHPKITLDPIDFHCIVFLPSCFVFHISKSYRFGFGTINAGSSPDQWAITSTYFSPSVCLIDWLISPLSTSCIYRTINDACKNRVNK